MWLEKVELNYVKMEIVRCFSRGGGSGSGRGREGGIVHKRKGA